MRRWALAFCLLRVISANLRLEKPRSGSGSGQRPPVDHPGHRRSSGTQGEEDSSPLVHLPGLRNYSAPLGRTDWRPRHQWHLPKTHVQTEVPAREITGTIPPGSPKKSISVHRVSSGKFEPGRSNLVESSTVAIAPKSTTSSRSKRGTDGIKSGGQARGKGRQSLQGDNSTRFSSEVQERESSLLLLNRSLDGPNIYTNASFHLTLQEPPALLQLQAPAKRRRLMNPFYPVTEDSYGAYAVMCLSIVIFVIGIMANLSIMCIVCHNYYMRSISNSLLANLAFWDFLVIFFCLPLVIFHELTKTWLLGDFTCKVIPYLEVASLGVTTFTLCALCIDRFRAATNVQMYYEMIENCSSTAAKLAVIWVGALLLALPEIALRQLSTEEVASSSLTVDRCVVKISTKLPDSIYVLALTYDGARMWWYFGCYFCLPTLFTIGSSVATARKIRAAEKSCARGNKRQIQLEGQMNCTVVALTILYGFCIVPENICNIVTAYMATGVSQRTVDLLQLISQFLLFFKSCVTPVVLFCLCKPFSRAFLDCCCCCCGECGGPKLSAAASEDNDNEYTTELELSPFSTIRREMSTYTSVATHC